MFTVYALSSTTKDYIYVGLTSNLSDRVRRHNAGYERTTKPHRPFDLFFSEPAPNRIEARKREKYWKSGVGKERLRQIREQCRNAGLSADR